MALHLNGHVLPIAKLGPDFLVLTHPVDHSPVEAEIAMSIDGHERRWLVRLHEGISTAQRRTRFSACSGGDGPTVR